MQNPFYFKSNGEFSSRQALELTKFTPFGTTFAFPIEKVKIFIIVVGVRLCAPRRTAENTGHTEKICRGVTPLRGMGPIPCKDPPAK